MRIVFQHDSVLPVAKYGGIERMIFWHMKELVKQGHEAVLIGHPESDVERYGIKLIPQKSTEWWKQIPEGTDGIQLFYNFAPPVDIPLILNIGGNGKKGEKFHRNTVFVSGRHAKNHNSNSFIYNAIDFEEYPFQPNEDKQWQNFMFLAKASWKVKNLKDCLWACKKSKKNLLICGGKSYMPSRYVKNFGMVDNNKKLEVMRESNAFLFPVRWHEPFGIAVIEAMSQGLPAFTSSFGSLPELIENDDLGLVLKNKDDLLKVISTQPKEYNPETIRKHVEQKYCISKFSESFVELFKRVGSGEFLNDTEPEWSLENEAQFLLDF